MAQKRALSIGYCGVARPVVPTGMRPDIRSDILTDIRASAAGIEAQRFRLQFQQRGDMRQCRRLDA